MHQRLVFHAWLEGSIPSDPTKLCRLLRINRNKLGKVWPAISPCWSEQGADRLIQARLEVQRIRQQEVSLRMSENGQKGGRPLGSTAVETNGVPAAKQQQSRPEAEKSFPSPSPSPTAKNGNGVRTSEPVGSVVAVEIVPATDTLKTRMGKPEPRKPRPATWLTPFGEAWKERWGVDSEPKWGQMGNAFEEPLKRLGESELLSRWRRYLAEKPEPDLAVPRNFISGLGHWSGNGKTATALRPVAMTVNERSMQAVARFIAAGEETHD